MVGCSASRDAQGNTTLASGPARRGTIGLKETDGTGYVMLVQGFSRLVVVVVVVGRHFCRVTYT